MPISQLDDYRPGGELVLFAPQIKILLSKAFNEKPI